MASLPKYVFKFYKPDGGRKKRSSGARCIIRRRDADVWPRDSGRLKINKRAGGNYDRRIEVLTAILSTDKYDDNIRTTDQLESRVGTLGKVCGVAFRVSWPTKYNIWESHNGGMNTSATSKSWPRISSISGIDIDSGSHTKTSWRGIRAVWNQSWLDDCKNAESIINSTNISNILAKGERNLSISF